MSDLEFINITVGILKEVLEDIPDEYIVRFEDDVSSYPIKDYEVEDEFKELTLKMGDREMNNIHLDCENYNPKKDYCLKFFTDKVSEKYPECQEYSKFNDTDLQKKWSN